jgi:hypothetical protein
MTDYIAQFPPSANAIFPHPLDAWSGEIEKTSAELVI